jgi:hypothetical protein
MNDLRTLGDALSPDEPSQDVVDRSRHRLLNHMRDNRPVRRRVWLPIATALTAAAAIAAVALVALPSTDTKTAASGQDVLLAAADAAERSPEGSGTYWHLTVGFGRYGNAEFWIKPNGEYWFRNHNTEGAVWPSGTPRLPKPFSLESGVELTFDQLRALPTDPAALRAWVDEAVVSGHEQDKARATMSSLVALVSTVPAPPDVRATAFRALAAYPGIENLGPVPGGQAVLLPGNARLVVDLAAGLVNRMSGLTVMSVYVVDSGQNDLPITARWTDEPPV